MASHFYYILARGENTLFSLMFIASERTSPDNSEITLISEHGGPKILTPWTAMFGPNVWKTRMILISSLQQHCLFVKTSAARKSNLGARLSQKLTNSAPNLADFQTKDMVSPKIDGREHTVE